MLTFLNTSLSGATMEVLAEREVDLVEGNETEAVTAEAMLL